MRSPTRVDLAGGTLDCWPLYVMVGGAETTNLSVSIFTYVELESRDDGRIMVASDDLSYRREFKSLEEAIACPDEELDLVRAHLHYWQPQGGFNLRTRSESPVGGGLGGSSSLCVSLIKAFAKWYETKLSTLEMVTLAHNLEAEVLKKPTGTQDYFSAIEPGLNVIHYTASGPRLERLRAPTRIFAERMLLVYTGQPHHSGLNNWQVIKSVIDGHQETLATLAEIRRVGAEMARTVRASQWDALPELFRQEFAARIRLSKGFSSQRIEELERVTKAAGADAVKICGAGGGGCVLVWTSPERRAEVGEICRKNGFRVLDAVPVEEA